MHILVAEAFLGPRPEGAHVLHIESNTFDSINNAASNLRYGSHSENMQQRTVEGNCHLQKLTQEQVLNIVTEYNTGSTSLRKLAKKFGVNKTTIESILIGKSYSYLTGIKKK